MKINQITVENFRNFSQLQASFEDVNIIWGENAQGKTNLMEAIYLFTGAHSFRGAKDKELIRFHEEKSLLTLAFEHGNREQTAQLLLSPKRAYTLNGIKKSSAALAEQIKAVVFSPEHLSMVKDGPGERRRFIDSALCQIKSNYRRLLREYQRALVQRNTLLRDMQTAPETESMLSVWNAALAGHGAKIIYQRLKYLEAVMPYAAPLFNGISGGKDTLELVYSYAYPADIAQIEQSLFAQFDAQLAQDRLHKTTAAGPHREDIDILINGKQARLYGSQGQQRSAVLAIKLAEAELLKEMTQCEPIALLDDVMSELDETRQDYILNHIKSRQLFITCCDKEQILRLKQGKTIHISEGKIAEH